MAKPGLLIRILAGLQAGIVGVLCMFGWFVVTAAWNHRSIWVVPNLFSTLFYGDGAYEGVFLRSTWAGLALIIALYGLLGALWGCARRTPTGRIPVLWGVLTGLAVYYLFFDFVWPYVDPEIPLYAPVRQLQVAHVLWGMMLTRSNAWLPNVAELVRGPSAPKQDDYKAAESVSGEVIR